MRLQIHMALLALVMGVAGPSWAQEPKTPEVLKAGGTIYRCTTTDGTIWYKNKPLEGADCRIVGSYKPRMNDAGKPKPPSGWIYLTSSTGADTYVQSSSIRRSGERVGVWVMDNFQEPQTNKLVKAPFLTVMRRLSVKCEDRQIFAQKTTFTSAPFGRGEYVGDWQPVGVSSDFATPGSVDDAIAAHVCRSK